MSSSSKTAAETAYKYLASRMRTSAEVRKHLLSKGYDSEETEETIRDLIGMKYLDDYQYALRYFEYNREKRRGSLRAARELSEKGIAAETIRNAREDYLYAEQVDEYAEALAAAERELAVRYGTPEDPDGLRLVQWDDRLTAAIARKLDGRGFDRNDIFKVLDELRRRCEE